MSNDVVTIDYSNKDVIKVLKNTVAQGASDDEFAMFAELCKSTGLNPFKKEVWFIKSKGYTRKNGEEVEGKVQLMTGINGFYAIANKHSQYDGTEIEESETRITISSIRSENWKGEVTIHKIEPAIEVPEWIEAKVYRKDRSRASTARAKWSEYGKELVSQNGKRTIWGTMPTIMLTKCAESMALRKAFPQELNGLYTQEEMPPEFSKVEVKESANLTIADKLPKKGAIPYDDDIVGGVTEQKKAGETDQRLEFYCYNLTAYPFKDQAHMERFTKKLAEKGGVEVFEQPGFWNMPEALDGLSQYLIQDKEAA